MLCRWYGSKSVEKLRSYAACTSSSCLFADEQISGTPTCIGEQYLFLIGPTGADTSMLARRLTTILPELTLAEAIETTSLQKTHRRSHGVGHDPPISRAPPDHLGCGTDWSDFPHRPEVIDVILACR
jgi:hypothetical protein